MVCDDFACPVSLAVHSCESKRAPRCARQFDLGLDGEASAPQAILEPYDCPHDD